MKPYILTKPFKIKKITINFQYYHLNWESIEMNLE